MAPAMMPDRPTIVALAGRRIDKCGSFPPRFPLSAVPSVKKKLTKVLMANVQALVCSAACGADLVALEVAEQLGLRRRIVLPFPAHRFRSVSVVDCPGHWGPLFDRVIDGARSSDDLLILHEHRDDDAYRAANAAILRQTQLLANEFDFARTLAVIVWEGAPHSGADLTNDFRRLAEASDFEQQIVLTLQ